jgi:hypothetical protein
MVLPELLTFRQQRKNKNGGKVKNYFIRENARSTQYIELVRQLDMKDKTTLSMIGNSKNLDSVLNTMMLGSLALNLLVSVSLKQVFKTVKIAQLITFLVLIEINFAPITQIFL